MKSASTLAALCLFVLFSVIGGNAGAQSYQNIGNLLAIQQRMLNVAPDMGDGAGSEITGYRGGKFRGMSKTEIEAFLNSPHNWFMAVGKGGTPFTKPIAIDGFAKVLSDADEQTYRKIFALIGQGNFRDIPSLTEQVQNKILLGHVEAAKLLRPDMLASVLQMNAWLEKYADLPEADDIYAKAKKLCLPSDNLIARPNAPPRFAGSVERADGGGTIEWNAAGILTAAGGGKSGSAFGKLLRQGKLDDAIQLIDKQKADGSLSEARDSAARIALAEILMRNGKAAKAWPLIRDADLTAAKLDDGAYSYALWLKGLIAWTQDAHAAAYDSFASLTERNLPNPNKAAAAFWASRAAEKLGRTVDLDKFIKVASEYPRTFYGLLALNRINIAAHYNWTLPTFNKATADAFKKEPAGQRALALLQLGERTLAEAELIEMPVNGKEEIKSGLVAIASRYALPSLSVQVGSAFGTRYDAALYPLIPWQPADGFTADPALVLAVAKNESHFNHTAVSPAGATGLMQIMPETAEMMQAGSSKTLYDPQANVTLGDKYLEMLTRTDGIENNLLFIIGSYNAGPKRILSLYQNGREQNGDDPLLFIETLPIKETRDYMQKVMATYWVYRARFNSPLTAMAELTVGRWPTYKRGDVKLTMNDKADAK